MSNSSSPPPTNGTVLRLPLHALPDTPGQRVVRRPGRPRKIVLPPTTDEREYHASIRAARNAAVASDALINAKSSTETIAAAILELAKEAASLGWERERAEEKGLDSAAQISSRRVDALSKLASLIVDARKLDLFGAHPSPSKLAIIMTFWLQSVGAIAFEVLPTDIAETLMRRYEEAMAEVDLAALMNG